MAKKMAIFEEETKILKKHGHICKEVSFIYKFTYDNKSNHDIKLMCSTLKVSRSSFYKYFKHQENSRSKENKKLKERIVEIYTSVRERY
ncbi:hypothetical protein [Clostridium omnivorum]|uniref:Transposase n=1 Tax=Clostridium omnivorum TaxID=1604902 RepID=A0ABQ5N7T1_9CLOT|nr:hypothetical protein [Clostridium sp. E14]GLC31149.1 hypothetical protein bsdE14_25590 [Clostridium sp. E14]